MACQRDSGESMTSIENTTSLSPIDEVIAQSYPPDPNQTSIQPENPEYNQYPADGQMLSDDGYLSTREMNRENPSELRSERSDGEDRHR